MNLPGTLWHYWRAKRLRFATRAALEAWQQRQLQRFARQTLSLSPWFRRCVDQPWADWPEMDKALMMEHFDAMNTAGLRKAALLECALRSEQDRNFAPRVGAFSVGLSSGTSGQRGLFVVSPREQQVWAGGMLAKMLPDGLMAGERVALFLRADSNLYQSVNNRWLSLAFYDLFSPFAAHLPRLQNQAPTIIVAPAQVLRALALAQQDGQLALPGLKKMISVAEVLEPQDRLLLQRTSPCVAEVYQATEGFLAATCAHGALHLNEEFVHIEPRWLDAHRFTPVITDFTRRTQPIVRYRLDDVLHASHQPCACGNPARVITAIEGRQDDQLLLADAQGRRHTVFADLLSRSLAQHLPLHSDYRLEQLSADRLHLAADCDAPTLERVRLGLEHTLQQQGVATQALHWQLQAGQPIAAVFERKRRRIVRHWEPQP